VLIKLMDPVQSRYLMLLNDYLYEVNSVIDQKLEKNILKM
jgi:hypothetical protein